MIGLFRGAKKTQTTMKEFRSEISRDELNELHTISYEGKIFVIDDSMIPSEIINDLSESEILGFDTETKPSFKKGQVNRVSLLQLASENAVYLFRLLNGGFPGELKEIFENDRIIKAGVAIRDDLKKLKAIRNFNPSGFCELQQLSSDFGIQPNSLRKLSAIILGFRISKSQQLTNWEALVLTEPQIIYAATDAWVSRELYLNLINAH